MLVIRAIRKSIAVAVTAMTIVFAPSSALAWGAPAHRYIMRRAIDLLPQDMSPFFRDHREELVLRVNDPDLWRTAGWDEAANHFVDFGMTEHDPPSVPKARESIDRDLRAMGTDNMTADELHQAKALLLRQMPLRESSEDAVAGGLLARAQMGLPLDDPARAAARYLALTADEVRAAFAKWINADRFVQVARGPASP
jgi:hypothetical protein